MGCSVSKCATSTSATGAHRSKVSGSVAPCPQAPVNASTILYKFHLQGECPLHRIHCPSNFSDAYINFSILFPSARGVLIQWLREQQELAPYLNIAEINTALIPKIMANDRSLVTDESCSTAAEHHSVYYRAIYHKLLALGAVLSDPMFQLHSIPLQHAANHTATRQIVALLGYLCGRLVANGFYAHQEGHSVIMCGARGTGKTCALQRFAMTATVAFPTLRVIYIDCRGIEKHAHPLRSRTLCQLILEILFNCGDADMPGFNFADPTGSSASSMVSAGFAEGVDLNGCAWYASA
jgi:hypothetical protein